MRTGHHKLSVQKGGNLAVLHSPFQRESAWNSYAPLSHLAGGLRLHSPFQRESAWNSILKSSMALGIPGCIPLFKEKVPGTVETTKTGREQIVLHSPFQRESAWNLTDVDRENKRFRCCIPLFKEKVPGTLQRLQQLEQEILVAFPFSKRKCLELGKK